jgi:hypothetical protein
MSTAVTGSLVDLLQLSILPPKSSSHREKKLQAPHRWTDEERNLVSYLRLHRDWSWGQIQRTFFPSITPAAIRLLDKRLSAQERAYRASTASSHVINPVDLVRVRDNNLPVWRTSIQLVRPGHIESNVGSASSKSPRGRNGNTAHKRTAHRSDLRPDRPAQFSDDGPPTRVDRSHFPHFFKTFATYEQVTGTDMDYVPPSHSPTPSPSTLGPSTPSSQLSEASSGELLGLEVRVVSASARDPSTPTSLSEEFFSAEEGPLTP